MVAHAPKSLRSFYGASDRLVHHEPTSAAHHETVRTLIGSPTQERPQEVYTPPEIRDLAQAVFGGPIRLDPCAGPDSILQPERAYYGQQVPTGKIKKDGTPVYKWEGPGLTAPWCDSTYCNSPYDELEPWMEKAAREATKNFEILQLVPVRCHRKWWRRIALRGADAIGWLDPLQFLGFAQTFPAPLALLYWGITPNVFCELFENKGLGDAELRTRPFYG